jgi:type IV pilus assembly protein PilE
MGRANGFTLIEVMITIVIIAILAGIALPSYNEYVVRSKLVEATANLADLRVKMEQYYMDNRRYSSDAAGGTCGIAGGDTPTVNEPRYFQYSCASSNANAAGDQQYLVTATGVIGEGLDGISFTVNHANAKATVVAPSSAMANRGYASATCWVRRKPAQC